MARAPAQVRTNARKTRVFFKRMGMGGKKKDPENSGSRRTLYHPIGQKLGM
jgi:hypothetical protein